MVCLETEFWNNHSVAVSCGYGTWFAVRTCDGLYHFIFPIDRVGIPFGFQPIIWTFIIVLPAVIGPLRLMNFGGPGVLTKPRNPGWVNQPSPLMDNHSSVQHYHVWSIFSQMLHGLCFGCCFSGPLPLRSLINGPPMGVHFRESLVITVQVKNLLTSMGVLTLSCIIYGFHSYLV